MRLLLGLLILVGLLVNAGLFVGRLLRTACTGSAALVFGFSYGLFVVATLVCFVASYLPSTTLPSPLLRLSHYGLSVVLFTVLVANLLALLLWLGRIIHATPIPLSARASGLIFMIMVILIAALAAYSIFQATRIQTKRYSVQLDGERDGGQLKLALISDLHLGHVIDEHHIARIAETINAMEPDIVCIAGDIIDGNMRAIQNPSAVIAAFRSIDAPLYACLGNHDSGDTLPEMCAFLADAGMTVLQDESAVVQDRLLLVGRRDSSPIGWSDTPRKPVEIPKDHRYPVVVLDHQPSTIAEYGSDVNLILCGHTHRGQIFPGSLVTRKLFAVDYGYYQKEAGSPQVIVTSGAGFWGPVARLGSQTEVVEVVIE